MDTANNTYPALKFPSSELSAFTYSIDCFIISLKNGELINFTPDNVQTFYDWLIANGVRDIKKEPRTNVKPPLPETFGTDWKGLFKRKKQNGKL